MFLVVQCPDCGRCQATQGKALPVLGQVLDFRLYDTEGKEFGLTQLKGKVWVADFIFTTCGGICPLMSQNMAAIYRALEPQNDIQFVSISVNPTYDSPDVLKDYAKRYQADTNKWHFLTGSAEAIRDLAANGFKIGSVDEPAFHSGYFVLVDQKSQIRGYYDGTKQERLQKLREDMAILLKEKN